MAGRRLTMTDPWRYRCPEGHTSWTPVSSDRGRNGPHVKYYCRTCKDHYDELIDAKELSDA